jgi:hypothetical protein
MLLNEVIDQQKQEQLEFLKDEFNFNDQMVSVTFNILHESVKKAVKKSIVTGNAGMVENFFLDSKSISANEMRDLFCEEFREKIRERGGVSNGEADDLCDEVVPSVLDRMIEEFQSSGQQESMRGIINFLQIENDKEIMDQLKHYLDKEIEGKIGGIGRITGQGFTPPDNDFSPNE